MIMQDKLLQTPDGVRDTYTLYDGGYNFATLLYAVYSDVNGWTVQMEKE